MKATFIIFIVLIMLSISGCVDNYVPSSEYQRGYNQGYIEHNVTVLDSCTEVINAGVFIFQADKYTNKTTFDYILPINVHPIAQRNIKDRIVHVLPYSTPISNKYFNMEKLDDMSGINKTDWMFGYIAGYDDWYNNNKPEPDELKQSLNESIEIINNEYDK